MQHRSKDYEKDLFISFQESQRKPNQGENSIQNMISDSNSGEFKMMIMQKIQEVDEENKKLLSITEDLTNSSVSRSELGTKQELMAPLVYDIEKEMKKAFNDLINSIQQFYIDIDTKLKEVCLYVAKMSNSGETQATDKQHLHEMSSSSVDPRMTVSEKHQIKAISQRMENLEKNLQQTQSNEKQLMSIIIKMMNKYQIHEESTFLREEPMMQKLHSMKFIDNEHLDNGMRVKAEKSMNRKSNYGDGYVERKNFLSPAGNNYSKNISKNSSQEKLQKFSYAPSEIERNHQQRATLNPMQKYGSGIRAIDEVPNDYSIHQQLRVFESQHQRSLNHNREQQPSYAFSHRQQKVSSGPNDRNRHNGKGVSDYDATRNRRNPQYGSQAISISTSNAVSQPRDEQCFIRKLYSKPNTCGGNAVQKVSLKGKQVDHRIPNKKEKSLMSQGSNLDTNNKEHRHEYLLKNLMK